MIKTSEHRLGDLCKRFSSGKGITAERISETGDYPVIGGNGLRGFKDSFRSKIDLLLNHFIDMAVQGYGWISRAA